VKCLLRFGKSMIVQRDQATEEESPDTPWGWGAAWVLWESQSMPGTRDTDLSGYSLRGNPSLQCERTNEMTELQTPPPGHEGAQRQGPRRWRDAGFRQSAIAAPWRQSAGG
jgi:hypothetical protein